MLGRAVKTPGWRFHCRNCRPARSEGGFSLVELSVVVVLIGILAALAVPPLQEMVLQQRVRNAAFDLNAAMQFARSEALKRNGDILLKSKSNSGDWSSGWLVEGSVNGATVTLKDWGPYSSVSVQTSRPSVTYHRSGRTSNAQTAFNIDDSYSLDGVSPRCLTLDVMGKPSSATGACDDDEQ